VSGNERSDNWGKKERRREVGISAEVDDHMTECPDQVVVLKVDDYC